MNAFGESDETNILWEFKRIKGHQGPMNKNHPDYKGSSYNVTIEWENGEITDEPLSIIAVDAPIACANMLEIILYYTPRTEKITTHCQKNGQNDKISK